MYLINELANLAGVSTRTLRYYDDIGLLKPSRITESGYRVYGDIQVNTLQQILTYKKLGFDLKQIKSILFDTDFDQVTALERHLTSLQKSLKQTQTLIQTIEKTIAHQKGEINMTDQEKFAGLKEREIKQNEKVYGKEARAKYGDSTIDEANNQYMAQTESDYYDAKKLGEEILIVLKEALVTHDPKSDIAQHVCELHQKWIKCYWPTYSKDAHLALVQMYLADERFKAYYEKVGVGATQLLVDAMTIYLK